MLIVLYKWHFYVYFIELVSFNTELYSKASACFYVQMFCWNHNTHWMQDGYIEAKQVERSQRRGKTLMCVPSQKVDGLSVCIYQIVFCRNILNLIEHELKQQNLWYNVDSSILF